MMSARLTDDTLATVLLCGGLGATKNSATPLSLDEWNRLVRALLRASWRPGDILRWGIGAARDALSLDATTADRLDELLGQAVPVVAEIERLSGAGIAVFSRADEAYPSRWRSRLREQSPPLIFVAGSVSLLARCGVAAVGSRDVDEQGTNFARIVGRATASARLPLISGGARGVDREAMFGSLEAGGDAMGIVADGLARLLRSPEVRRWVGEGQLVLASPYRPDAGFKVWRAMQRNKLIYGLADVAVVISSDAERGGTWAGARENLRHDWTPLFVRAGQDVPEGNRKLLELGALAVDDSDFDVSPPDTLLARLLKRAASEAAPMPIQPAQQSFLSADPTDEQRAEAPSTSKPTGRLAIREESPRSVFDSEMN